MSDIERQWWLVTYPPLPGEAPYLQVEWMSLKEADVKQRATGYPVKRVKVIDMEERWVKGCKY